MTCQPIIVVCFRWFLPWALRIVPIFAAVINIHRFKMMTPLVLPFIALKRIQEPLRADFSSYDIDVHRLLSALLLILPEELYLISRTSSFFSSLFYRLFAYRAWWFHYFGTKTLIRYRHGLTWRSSKGHCASRRHTPRDRQPTEYAPWSFKGKILNSLDIFHSCEECKITLIPIP